MNVLNIKEMAAVQGGRKNISSDSVTRNTTERTELTVERVFDLKAILGCW